MSDDIIRDPETSVELFRELFLSLEVDDGVESVSLLGDRISEFPHAPDGGLSKFAIEKISPLVDGCSDLNTIKGKVEAASCSDGSLTIKI